MNHSLAKLPPYIPEFNISYNSRFVVSVNEISLPIWQPPQLV
jgi:hypothetical protein